MYARQLTFTFKLYVTSVAACQLMMQRRWRPRQCRPGWITATRSCTAHLHPTSTNYSVCRTHLTCTIIVTRKCDHITLVLANLRWLPITARIQLKIALQTFQTLTTHQPSHIHYLLQQHRSSQLRSSRHNVVEIPQMRTGFAQRSFTYSAPHI